MNPKVYILLPVHNRRAITEKFIDCLVAQSFSNYHLILIDDGSADGSSEMVSAKISNLTIIRGKGDWWWAGSLQQGIDWLNRNAVEDEDVIVFMNDDIEFESNFLEIALKLLDQQDGMLLPQVFNQKTGLTEESGVCADFKKLKFITAESSEEINCLPTRGLFMRMAELIKVGGFYPRLLPHYLSDYEFSIRANRMGMRLLTSPRLFIRSDDEATGYRSFEDLPFFEFMKRYYSIKSAANPLYWTTFVLLASPKSYIPLNVLRVWLRAAKAVFRQAIRAFVTGKHRND